jgi:MFS family permease
MVPETMLGIYFSRRTRLTQMLNVVMSLALAFLLDYIRDFYPDAELQTYAVFFILAGAIGILGGYLLSKAPEPQSKLSHVNLVSVFTLPLQNINFRRLLFFNSAWVFAINLGIPFFSAYMLKGLGLPISYVIILNVISQIMSILTIRIWGIFSDKYSNKTIIGLSAPIYIASILAWCFVGLFDKAFLNLVWLAGIHFFMGIATAGINLSLTNIGLKLAPNKDAIVYLSVKNIITAVFSSIAPLIGGLMADYFTKIQLTVSVQWNSPNINRIFKILSLHEWNFLFLISAALAIISMEFLIHINEVGEMDKFIVRRIMRTTVRKSLREYFLIGNIISIHDEVKAMLRSKKVRKPQKTTSTGG